MNWNTIKNILYDAIVYRLENEQLHDSALNGLITLIPKANRDNRKIVHQRPISLLNVDYKAIEKVFANRLKGILEDFVDKDQKGFTAGRHGSVNIRRVLDLMEIGELYNLEGVVLSLDYEKCFDRVEIESIIGALDFFGVGTKFQKWTRTIFRGANATVINNGKLTQSFKLTRGLRQGGCCSPYYFLCCAEVLAILLRSEKNIKGFMIEDFEKILGQFADDMDMYLLYEENTLKVCLKVLNRFQQNTGFKINYDKTVIYRIGSI